MTKLITVYITTKDKKQAEQISMHLLKKRLIACSNTFPLSSMYWWKNKIVHDKEFGMLCKTQNKHFSRIKKEVERIHTYEIPCIEKINSDANKKYKQWIEKETR